MTRRYAVPVLAICAVWFAAAADRALAQGQQSMPPPPPPFVIAPGPTAFPMFDAIFGNTTILLPPRCLPIRERLSEAEARLSALRGAASAGDAAAARQVSPQTRQVERLRRMLQACRAQGR